MTTSQAAGPLPGEDVLTIPDSWRRHLHPRRGGTPAPAVKTGPASVKAMRGLLDRAGGAITALTAGEVGNPSLAAAARRHLDGSADPAGAAALAAVTASCLESPRPPAVHRAFVDAWAAEHGAVFAACAVMELSRTGTVSVRRKGGPWGGRWIGAVLRTDRDGTEPDTFRRVRALLAAADDDVYADAAERLAGYRNSPTARWFVSYLLPTRRDWLLRCLASKAELEGYLRWLKLCAVDEAAQLGSPPPWLNVEERTRGVLVTMVESMGTDLLPLLVLNLDQCRGDWDKELFLETIAILPSDEAFQVLVDRIDDRDTRVALAAAAARFPVRAVRLLAQASSRHAASPHAAALLEEHVRIAGETVTAALPGLPDDVRAAVESILAASVRVPDASADAVPAVLAEPPWERPRRPVRTGLRPPAARLAWLDGERDEWLTLETPQVKEPPADPDWGAFADGLRNGGPIYEGLTLVVHGPESVVRPLLSTWTPYSRPDTYQWMRRTIARYGLDTLAPALRLAKNDPIRGESLKAFLDADVALLMADWLARNTKTAHIARWWFSRHGTAAVPYLVPVALGKAGRPQRAAEFALRHLHDRHPKDDVVAAARAEHGDDAAEAVAELLAADPAETGLVRPPKIGDWADPAILPQVLLRGGERALPPDATRHLIQLLALPSAFGTDEIRAALDPGSVAEFGWALFQKWRDVGAPSKDGWALTQLGRSGDDATVRRLTPIIRAWPGEGGHKYAVTGLNVLERIGTDVALMHLHGIAQRVQFKGLQAEAQAGINAVARRLGLSSAQLADRLVPAFGLDAAGSMVLDYGPRRFVVGFDEQLKPVVSDEDGKPRKALPKPGAKDDPELAEAAYAAFTALKKDVRTVASGQLLRLEAAMTTGRRWTTAEFRDFIVGHPLVSHLARRLVWIAEDGGEPVSFRVVEDRTPADAQDDRFTLPETAKIGIAHPVMLGDTLASWSELFADYEILQPFPQLGRTVHTLTDEEREGDRLKRFEGLKVPFGGVLGLTRRGWDRGAPQGGGNEMWISRRVARDRYVVIGLDPGLPAAEVGANGDHQTLEHVWIAEKPTEFLWRPKETGNDERPPRMGELDPVTASEILADLTAVAATAVP
ncbi:DUF4132 domain-containing protein [Actinomadura roseirufa]|uniref:DUF4132 domain-containing protein n=1 Tax=Actinomadura roseirufa TaxID=2094049 RepID=UPI001041B2DB|nr:DUF4132 domain-containing protein [Actinomadura roseirufa]